jgi:inorganic pyrophosphatase
MTNAESTAEGFVAVLKALPKAERDAVVVRIARDKEFARDIVDLATIAERRKEPRRAFRKYLAEKQGG